MTQAVTKPIKALGLTSMLYLVFVYYFAIWGFGFLRGQYYCDE